MALKTTVLLATIGLDSRIVTVSGKFVDDNGKTLTIDGSKVAAMTKDEMEAFLNTAAQSGEKLSDTLARAAAPYLARAYTEAAVVSDKAQIVKPAPEL